MINIPIILLAYPTFLIRPVRIRQLKCYSVQRPDLPNGKNTTAVAGDNGTITYNLNDTIELGAETDSNNHIVVDGKQGLLTLGMDATINGNAGIASIGGVSIGKSGSDQVITGLTNRTWTVGTTQAVDGRAATENQLQSVADNLNTANTNIATLQHGFKVQANGDTTTESTVKADDALNFTAGDNTNVTTTKIRSRLLFLWTISLSKTIMALLRVSSWQTA